MIRTIERATGIEYRAKKIEGGFEVYTLTGEKYKKLKDSTFKRYFKKIEAEEPEVEPEVEEEPVVDEPEQEQPEPEVEAPKPEKKQKSAKKTEKQPEQESEPKQKKEEPKVELDDVSKQNMVEKIKKMLNLSKNNSSQEEATSAVLMAQKLMSKYGIHEEDITLEEVKDEIKSFTAGLKHNSDFHTWRKPLGSIVAKNFRVKTYLDAAGDVVFRGYADDAKIAVEVFYYLYAVGNRFGCKLYHDELAKTGSGKGIYRDFIVGFLNGIEHAFDEQCTALMIITPKEVEEEFSQFSEGFTKHTTKLKGRQNYLYDMGFEEGKNAVKSRQIEKKGGKK